MTLQTGDVIALKDRNVIVCGRPGGEVIVDSLKRVAVRNFRTNRLSYIPERTLLHAKGQAVTQSWAVSVERNGENIVTLASNCLGGKDPLSDEDARIIRQAGESLLAFIGAPPCGSGSVCPSLCSDCIKPAGAVDSAECLPRRSAAEGPLQRSQTGRATQSSSWLESSRASSSQRLRRKGSR